VLNHAMLNHPKVVRFKEVMLTPTKLAVISEVRGLAQPLWDLPLHTRPRTPTP